MLARLAGPLAFAPPSNFFPLFSRFPFASSSSQMAATRPTIQVFGADGKTAGTVKFPGVFGAPIRSDIVHFVFTNIAKNKRQAHAVNVNAGEQHSAESWGTGRAVARIPRISGGGTSASGSGAFGNMCRGGRMFAPSKVWRRWHRRVNLNQRRLAVASALSASAVVPLVMARGHRVDAVPEIPLVVSNNVQSITKTSAAVKALKAVGAFTDVEKVKDTKRLRGGVGKLRNRRYVLRKGPLVIYKDDSGITRAFRNLPGVDLVNVTRMNLLKLAPGGHVGRFCIWTEDAVKALDGLFGAAPNAEAEGKHGFRLPVGMLCNADVARIINSQEVQAKLRPKNAKNGYAPLKKNPLRNRGAYFKLNPAAPGQMRRHLKHEAAVHMARAKARAAKKA